MSQKSQKSGSVEMEAKNDNVKRPVFYHQKFRQEWKSDPLLRDWLREKEGDTIRSYCRYCKCNMFSKYSKLLKHAKTKKHLRAASLFESPQEDEETTDSTVKHAPSAAVSRVGYQSKNNAQKSQEGAEHSSPSQGNKHSIKIHHSGNNKSDDDECMDEYNIFSDDEEEISQMITDNEVFINTSPGISQKLQAERIKAETEYFRQKALYFSKLVENLRVQRTLMIIQSRKLHLEVQKLQNEL